MQLKTIGESLNAINKVSDILNGTFITEELRTQALAKAMSQYSIETIKATLTQKNLNREQIEAILTAKGYQGELLKTTTDELANIASTNALSASQVGATATTNGLANAMKGLGSSILGAAKAHPILAIISAIALVGTAIVGVSKKIEEARQETIDAGTTAQDEISQLKNDLDSLASSAEEVGKTYSKLIKGVDTLNNKNVDLSDEDYNEFISSSNELAELFPQLVIGLDNEGNKILDLGSNAEEATSKINELIDAQRRLVAEETEQGLVDVFKGINEETRELSEELKSLQGEKDSSYLKDFLVTDLQGLGTGGISLSDTYAAGLDTELLMNNVAKIINEALGTNLKPEYNELTNEWFVDMLSLDDSDKQKAVTALQENSDFLYEVATNSIDNSISNTKNEINNKYKSQLSSIYTALYDDDSYSSLSDANKKVAESLIAGLDYSHFKDEIDSDFGGDIISFINDNILNEFDDLSNNPEISKALSEVFTNVELTPDAKVNYIKQIQDYFGEGHAITLALQPQLENIKPIESAYGDIISKTNSSISKSIGSIDDYKTSITSLTASYEALNNVLSEQNSQNYITSESYDELIKTNSEFANALEYGSGYMRINSEKAIELAEANAKVALAELEIKEALEVQQYNENAKEIDQLENSVTVLTQAELDHLNQLKAENSEIEGNIRQYDLLESQIEQTLSGYNRFRQALETPNQDDAYLNIIEHLQTMKELYDQNLIGYDEFQAGMSAYIGENASIDDFANSYKQLTQYFTEGQEGFDKFMNDLVKVGELQLDTDGNIVGDLDWESAKKSLAEYLGIVEITDEAFQALIGRGEAYGAVLSTSNGVDGIEDLTQAQNELNASIEGYKKVVSEKEKAGLDTSAEEEKIKSLETQLETTTQKIEEFSETEVEGEIKFDLDAELAKLDTSNLSAEAQSTLNQLNATNEQIKLNAQMGVDTTYLEGQAKTQLNLLKEQMNVPVEVSGEEASETIDNLTISSQNATLALKDTNTAAYTLSRTSIGDLGLSATKIKAQGLQTDIRNIGTELDNLNGKSISIKVNTNGGKSGDSDVFGTTGGFAHALGTAFANGNDIGAKQSSLALTGELGRELVVRGNRWFTVGDNGAEFAHIKKGDIVFNAEQTRQLLEGSGHINSRGHAFASGTAYNEEKKNKSQIQYTTKDSGKDKDDSTKKKDSSTDKTNDKAKNLIDWIARRLEVLQTKADRWAKIIENATNEKKITKYYNKLESVYKKQMKTTFDGASRYLSKANSIKLDSDLKAKVRSKDSSLFTKDGNLKSYKQLIKNYGEKTYEAISQYQDWYDKYQSCIDSYIEATENLYNAPLEEASAKIELLADSLELLDAKLENATVDGYKDANALIDKQVANQKSQESANKTAFKDAKSNLKSAKKPLDTDKELKKFSDLSKKERKKVLDAVKKGEEIDITLFKEGSKGYKKALAYNVALQARNDAEKEYQLSVEETAKIEREAEKQKFDNIQNYYEKQVELIQIQEDAIQQEIDLAEARGITVTAKSYEQQIQYEKDKQKQLQASKDLLTKQLAEIEKGTEEWYEANSELADVNAELEECNITIAEMNHSITELADNFQEKMAKTASTIREVMDWSVSLMDEYDKFDSKTGAMTKEGLASLGSYVSNRNNSSTMADNYGKQVAKMEEEYAKYEKIFNHNNPTSYEFIDANGMKRTYNSLEEFKTAIDSTYESWRDQISETAKYESQIIDFMRQKYENELKALKDLIDAKKDALQVEKDLQDYQKSVRQSTDNISSLQKQIQALRGDSSEENQMRLQKLNKELEDSKEELAEKEDDRRLSELQDSLDGLYSEYEDLIQSELSDVKGLLEKGNAIAQNLASEIGSTLDSYVQGYGYDGRFDSLDKGIEMIPKDVTNDEDKKEIIDVVKSTAKEGVKPETTNDNNNSTNSSTSNNTSKNNSSSVTINGQTYGTGYNAVNTIPIVVKTPKERALEFINSKASKAKKKKKEYSDVNKKIWDYTKGKVLSSDELKRLAELVGVKYDNAKKSGKLYKKLKSLKIQGFSKGGVVSIDDIEKQVRANGDTVLGSLNPDERVLTPVQNKLFEEFINNGIPELNATANMLQPLVNIAKLPNIQPITTQSQPANIEANYSFVLENCTNARDIIKCIQTDRDVQNALQDVTVNKLNGSSSRLTVNKYR